MQSRLFEKHLGKPIKLRTLVITLYFDNFILLRTLKLTKKNYQFEKSSEIDFQKYLLESQSHGIKPVYKNRNSVTEP